MTSTVTEFMMDWRLEDKFFTLTLDNAAANDSMVTILHDSFPSSQKFTITSNVFHVRCSAHVLNLIVQAGLGHIKGVIENVRESIKYIRGSTLRMKDFETSLVQVGVSGKMGLNMDVQTRWNSTYLMLRSTKEVKCAFNHLKGIDENYKWCPTDEDWKNNEEIESLLEVFYQATKLFFMSKQPTSNHFFLVLQKVKEKLDYFTHHEQGHMLNMVMDMKKKYDKYWTVNSLVLAIACVLDPRYKLFRIEFALKKLYPLTTVYDAELKKVNDALQGVYKYYENRIKTSGPHDYFPSCDDGEEKMLIEKEEFNRYMEAREKLVDKKSDLDAYLEESHLRLEVGAQFDILDYSKTASLKYKILGIMARDILAIPLSSVALKSAFRARRTISDYRSSLKPKTVEALI